MTISTSFITTTFISSKNNRIRSPTAPLNVMAMPNNTAKTMICSISPLAMALIGFEGNMSMKTCVTVLISPGANFASVERSTPTPGETNSASTIATAIASAVVKINNPIDLRPIRPSVDTSFNEAVPHTSETSTNGTTNILRLARKIWPPA